MFNNLREDFKRELVENHKNNNLLISLTCFGSQGFQAVLGYRLCHWLITKHIPFISIFIQRMIEITTGISISPEAKIGKGLLIYHFGGIVIHASSVIGNDCTLNHGVTIGNKSPEGKTPIIGNNVYIGAGAKVLGEITIGDNCKIGANAVVIHSFPENSTLVGIPAKRINE